MAATSRAALLLQQYHHIVLPRQVPGKEDWNLHQVESELLSRFIRAIKTLSAIVPSQHFSHVDAARVALSRCEELHVDGNIDRNQMVTKLNQLEEGHTLLLFVTEQNAALLIYKQVDDADEQSMIFETFEVSAASNKVLASDGALQWDFPGRAVSLPSAVFSNQNLQEALAAFLDQASFESVKQFAALTYKADAPLPEIRDTPDPTLISGLLMSILESNGASHSPILLRKRVRDTVSFEQAHKPWRRSAFYLAVRVAIQRHLYRQIGPEIGRAYYKAIMCIFLSMFLDDILSTIPYESCHFVRQKLSLRLSKIEVDRKRSPPPVRNTYTHLLQALKPNFDKSLSAAARFLESRWEAYKDRTRRIIRRLPEYADERDLQLKLVCSAPALDRAMKWQGNDIDTLLHSPADLLGRYENTKINKPIVAIINRYTELARFSENVLKPLRTENALSNNAEHRCLELSRLIKISISRIGNAFNDYPEMLSEHILTLMELWVDMDKAATVCYDYLHDYHPVFDADILDVLQLSSREDLIRVMDVQSYLTARCQAVGNATPVTIFTNPSSQSFAVRCYDEASDSDQLKALRDTIETDAENLRIAKELEWNTKSKNYEKLIQEKAGLSCVGFKTNKDGKSVHTKPCRWHQLKWRAKNIKIDAFEYPLPKSEPEIKAAVFELACPAAFAAYRDATYLILSTFAYPSGKAPTNNAKETSMKPMLLREYHGLQRYHKGPQTEVTLVAANKSHLDSHYKTWEFPVPFKKVCKNFGLGTPGYYDSGSECLVTTDTKPSFSSMLPLKLPRSSPFQSVYRHNKPWPSSNQILSTQTKCPSDLNVHEFMAWQGLLVGSYSRWPTLLRELASTNLNFSSDATWALISRLVLQVGPASTDDDLRDVHSVFRDPTFCKKLLEQIALRLASIQLNWREPVQMEILISLLCKSMFLSTDTDIRARTVALLDSAREATYGWCANLRKLSNQQAQGLSIYTIWASVLCKRSFHALAQVEDFSRDHDILQSFVTASIELHNNLVGDFEELPLNLRIAIVRDLLDVYRNRHWIQNVIQHSPSILLTAVNNTWPVPAECLQSPGPIHLDSDTSWMSCQLVSESAGVFYIHYHTISGTLLINGQPLGILPSEYQHWPIIKELFGNQDFQILPSPLPGMSLVVNREMPMNHWVHVGFRDKDLIIRAQRGNSVLELIHRDNFAQGGLFDLPLPLTENCYHWLNVHTGDLEIRQEDPFRSRKGNWRLDMHTRRLMRNHGSMLVDPHSALYINVTRNFHFFEYSRQILVIQPAKSSGSLVVELKRLELDFFVNRRGLLQSPQLNAVITYHQDAKTWYGLRSKIVICSVKNRSHRSILIPFGEAEWVKDTEHVCTTISNKGKYLRFTINEVLGRVECPTEPRLLYTRALCHALTSHFLPDPLTQRTGVEEALYYLQNAAHLPWAPLSPEVVDLLLQVASLSPARTYYPPNLKNMETTSWDRALNSVIQDDRYRNLVQIICQRNLELSAFGVSSGEQHSNPCSLGDPHLERRALSRIYAYRVRKDTVYRSRDTSRLTEEHNRVITISNMVSNWSDNVSNVVDLSSILQQFPIIGGYVRTCDMVQFTDLLTIDYGLEWGGLCQTAIASEKPDGYRLMFLLATIAFSPDANMDLLRVIVSFAILADLKALTPPSVPAYNHFQLGEVPLAANIAAQMEGAKVPMVKPKRFKRAELLEALQLDHESKVSLSCDRLTDSILAQWPSKHIDLGRLVSVNPAYIDRTEAVDLVSPEWTRISDNYELAQYLEKVQLVLNRHNLGEHEPTSSRLSRMQLLPTRPQVYPFRLRGGEIPTLPDLLEQDLPGLPKLEPAVLYTNLSTTPSSPQGTFDLNTYLSSKAPRMIKELRRITATLTGSGSVVQERYISELKESIDALSNYLASPKAEPAAFNRPALENDLSKSKGNYLDIMKMIRVSLGKGDCRAQWLQLSGLWPRVTAVTLLTELRSNSGTTLKSGTKQGLVKLGTAITTYQRLLRIEDASRKRKEHELVEECRNPGYVNWSPMEYVDWLLLEIDSNIMLRPEQIEVAQATIAPASSGNSVLQLLMGKGKTSAILPMVATVLADKRNLFRIVVPNPLLLQSAQVLQAKIGGLLNREVIHVPFSRKTPTDQQLVTCWSQLHQRMQNNNGVVLALPEHLLSFKLSGLQLLCDGNLQEAQGMIEAQAWLDCHARDVMDECDVSLAIRTQLIYPSGSQTTVDGHPLRWQTVQALLRLVEAFLPDLQRQFPNSVEVVKRLVGGYPLIYFLRRDIEDRLIADIVQTICRGHTSILPGQSITSYGTLQAFISEPNVSKHVVSQVTSMFHENLHLMDVARHLRGLFVHRIFISALKKRWNVQYGLHPMRAPVAVPYLAKGVPSSTSEFGHPDVALILTQLSFYYHGVSLIQFRQAFEELLKSDEPSIEYEKWATNELPEGLRDYQSINVEDPMQLRELYHYIKYTPSLHDFYLNALVFPNHAKQFSIKLQASSWDLVLYDPLKQNNCKATGFSGTNDSRHQLPLVTKQNDLPGLSHTNAEVLFYLLEPRNSRYVRMIDRFQRRLSEEGLLRKLMAHRIRVLIDAGAQILEHDNRGLAKLWLKIDEEAKGVVFLDAQHRPWIVFGKGAEMPLVASPFADNLEGCLVYIDENHCRGTDLKLPPRAKAALTLGLNLTKDALVQAAMRMRLLGQTQSVTFFAPIEVHQGIVDIKKATKTYGLESSDIDSSDVIRWLLKQTCNGIEQLESLYINQGTNFLRYTQAQLDFPEYLTSKKDRKFYLSVIQTKESQTLKQLYEPNHQTKGKMEANFAPTLQGYANELSKRKEELHNAGFDMQTSAYEEVEQEREMEIQVESVREVQKPVHFEAVKITGLHRDVKVFAQTGRLVAGSDSYLPMFFALANTSLGLKHRVATAANTNMTAGLHVSTQFVKTVNTVSPNDNFLRPCQWIVWSRLTDVGLLVSPEEANSLIPILRECEHQTPAHLIVYSVPLTRRMLHFNNLNYYAIPSLPNGFKVPTRFKVELGIFAGRLYFAWNEYQDLLRYLGIQVVDGSDTVNGVVKQNAFAENPLTFLHDWLAVRRKGQDFEHTPMGFVTTGKTLTADHAFFLEASEEKSDPGSKMSASAGATRQDEDENSDDGDAQEHNQLFRGNDEDDHSDDGESSSDEDVFDEKDNTFFDGGAYVEKASESLPLKV